MLAGVCGRRGRGLLLRGLPPHLGFYGVQKSQNQLQSEILLFLSNYTIKSIFSGVSPPPPPSKLKIFQPLDNAGLIPSEIGRIREI